MKLKSWQEELSDDSPGLETWQQKHYAVRTAGQHPVVILLDGVRGALASISDERTWPDSNKTAGFGQILEGIILLLNENLGGMDGGTLWSEVSEMAKGIGWDLDMSQIMWDESDV